MTDQRPDPDQLLDKIQREAEKCRRGRLKVFFGACAGVGKTYAMLSAARALRQQGVDVVVGVAETHGRSETAELLEGLEVLPPKRIQYRGRTLREFDLDGALRRKPAVLLLDELAHSNVLGSRHPKRWQDAEELLSAGIDVYTTVNVQHLEGLNDIVGQITGIRVRETLPDTVFELAEEVALVDLPPDELLQRLKEGKVYLPRQAEHAAENFFRKGNLIALRELALRRTADRVDAQMREYRTDRAIQGVWKAKERLLACVGPGLGAESLVRSASCLAADLRADWRAAYVETPGLQRLSASARGQVLKTLRLAQELGAETETLAGTDLAQVLLDYAHTHNISKILVGSSRRSALSRRLTPSVSERLASRSTDVNVHVVGQGKENVSRPQAPARLVEYDGAPDLRYRRYVWTALICAATTLVGAKLLWFFDLANIVMLYLLSVVLVAIRYGRGPGVFASFLGVAAFDFFLVPPKHSLTVADTQYLLTFAVLLSVALIISHLTANLRYQARIAQFRERRARALYEMGRELAAALTMPQIAEIAARHLYAVFQVKVALLLPDGQDKVAVTVLPPDVPDASPELDLGIAQWVYDHQEPAGMGTNTLPGSPVHYLPLKAPMRTRGVAAVVPEPRQIFLPEQQRLLDTFAAQIGLALERVHYVEVAQSRPAAYGVGASAELFAQRHLPRPAHPADGDRRARQHPFPGPRCGRRRAARRPHGDPGGSVAHGRSGQQPSGHGSPDRGRAEAQHAVADGGGGGRQRPSCGGASAVQASRPARPDPRLAADIFDAVLIERVLLQSAGERRQVHPGREHRRGRGAGAGQESCACSSRTTVRGFPLEWRNASSRSSPAAGPSPPRQGSAWGSPSAAPSSRRMGGNLGRDPSRRRRQVHLFPASDRGAGGSRRLQSLTWPPRPAPPRERARAHGRCHRGRQANPAFLE